MTKVDAPEFTPETRPLSLSSAQTSSVSPSPKNCNEALTSPAAPSLISTHSPGDVDAPEERTIRTRPSMLPVFRRSMLAPTVSPLCHGPPLNEGRVEPADSNTAEGMLTVRFTGNPEEALTRWPSVVQTTSRGLAETSNDQFMLVLGPIFELDTVKTFSSSTEQWRSPV